ncbi:MAG: hypothetical protein AAGA48_11005 [Myxococcota bacterium]
MRISWLSAALLAGCVIDAPNIDTDDTPEAFGEGTIEVSWRVGSSGCELAEVTDVQIQIGDLERTIPCTTGETSLQLLAGDYALLATGLDASGVARFEAREELVSVFEGETTVVPTLRLSALPATLTLFWKFENGSLCGANGVDSIDIALFNNEQIVAPFPIKTECSDGEEVFPGIPAGSYVVSMLGLNADDQADFEARQDVTLLRGEEASFELELVALDSDDVP